jgi:hypothetical protein
MPEQIHAGQEQQKRSRRRRANQSELQDTSEFDSAAREQLSRLDATLDEYLQSSAVDDAAIVGQPEAHLLARPLSNEALVRGFRQTRGE